MSLSRSIWLLTVALPVATSLGAPALDELRLDSKAKRETASQLRDRRTLLQQELDRVAAQIERLKARKSPGFIPNTELQSSLRQSQQLSEELSSLAKELSRAEAASEGADRELLSAISSEIGRLRSSWDAVTDRGTRQGLITQMRTLRGERDHLRAILPTASPPSAESPRPSEDPEDLLEQADVVRDREDKVKQQVRALEVRLTETREERDLDRRMHEFLKDEAMFDEQDQRLRVRGSTTFMSGSPGERQPTTAATPGAPTYFTHPTGTGTPAGSVSSTSRAVNPAPLLSAQPGPDERGASIRSMEAELQRLKSLADQLEQQAQRLEARARSLK